MKIFGLSPAAVAFAARHGDAQIIADPGDDFAEAPPVITWPAEATVTQCTMLQDIFSPSGWQFQPAKVVSVLGVVRSVDVRLGNVLALNSAKPVTVLALRGWREWSAAHVARGLRDAGYETRTVETQMHGTHVDASAAQVATRFDDPMFRNNLLTVLAGCEQVLLPPVLSSGKAAAVLASALGANVSLGDAVGTTQHLAAETQLALANATHAPAKDAREQLLAAFNAGESFVVASRRCAAWLEERFQLPRLSARVVRQGVLACGRARANVRTLGEEWIDGLGLAAELQREVA